MDAASGLPVCSRCERDDSNYISPDARMYYSPCNHAVCERCKRELFGRHRMQKCPAKDCGATIAVQDLSTETRDSKEFAEEKKVRKRLAGVFNKTLADFAGNAAAYDAYLEVMEGHVYTLVYGSEADKAAAEAAIAAYRLANQHAIASNTARAQVAQQRERERERHEAEARSAAATAAITAEARKKAVADALRGMVMDQLLGGAGAGAGAAAAAAGGGAGLGLEGGVAGVHALKQRLLMLQAQKLDGGSGGGAAGTTTWFIPCAHIPAPRFLEYTHPDWHAAHGRAVGQGHGHGQQAASSWDVGGASLPAHARAGGFTPAAHAAAVRQDVRAMLWG